MRSTFNLVQLCKFLACLSLFFVLAACRNRSSSALFKQLASSETGIDFNNKIEENDSINPLDLEFLYNGGGVAVGDFDNNGLPDLYFTASTTSNKLYLNKGALTFNDVTDAAHVTGEGRWCNAASVVDINSDGWEDIYVCTTIKKNPAERRNLLYINQGLNSTKIPVFKEMAADYNLADTSYSVHAAFFDYDNDGDLDMYLATTKLAGRTAVQFNNNGPAIDSKTDVDKLFRNDWNATLNHPVFTDVSTGANIVEGGFGLGLAIADINRDGWKDIYVTNDFYTNDLLYINNHDGTFTDKAKDYFKHTSQNAMGNDIADINNDGLADVLAVDMNPEDNFRKKKNGGSNNYFVYQNMMFGAYNLQYMRNTLQLNQGPRLNGNDSVGEPAFSEISFMAGVAQTDWSWNASIADFDNDGNRDIIITNGYPRDVTDHDFAAYRNNASPTTPKQELIDQIPQIRIPNYAFKNTGSLKFENVTEAWGFHQPSFSNGAVYVDLENDGDLDYVINNINEKAMLYENTTNDKTQIKTNFFQVKFEGDTANRNGIGAFAAIYYNNKQQVYENAPYRGYLSTVNTMASFGLGDVKELDSVVITWQNGKRQVLQHVPVNQLLKVDIKNATLPVQQINTVVTDNLFTDVTAARLISYTHAESDVIDFDKERLLPHKLSQYGPPLAAGDINGDGLDDLVIGGNNVTEPAMLLQQKGGTFSERQFPPLQGSDVRKPETMGMVLFDADGDGDLDLYMSSGSNEFQANTKNYQDRLFMNDGKGNFSWIESALPQNYTSKGCVKAADFDNDGDLDLFVSGRLLPGSYPTPVSSFIYRNDSKGNGIMFTNVTQQAASKLMTIGLVCDAIWTDFDNNGWIDLIVAGEWMSLRVFKNNRGLLEEVTEHTGIADQKGWWNSIAGGDFDNDGDIDYIVGNLGANSFYQASEKYPVNIYAKDFDSNGSLDALTTVYLKDQQNRLKEFTAQNRDDINSQLPGMKKKFLTYKDYGVAGFASLFSEKEQTGMLYLSANYLRSSYLENTGDGKFSLHPLPEQAQLAPVYGIITEDYNNDGNLDVALVGNDYGTEVSTGRYDALNGLVLLGRGNGSFQPQTILQSGLYVPGDAKALVTLRSGNGNYLMASSQNRGPLKVFQYKKTVQINNIKNDERYATVYLKNGKRRKEEFYYGHSFLSQSARFVTLDKAIEKIEIYNRKSFRTITGSN